MKEALKFLNKPLTIRWYSLDSGYTTIHISIQGPRYDTRYDTLLCAAKLVSTPTT